MVAKFSIHVFVPEIENDVAKNQTPIRESTWNICIDSKHHCKKERQEREPSPKLSVCRNKKPSLSIMVILIAKNAYICMLFCKIHRFILPRKCCPYFLTNQTSNTITSHHKEKEIKKKMNYNLKCDFCCSARSMRISRKSLNKLMGLFGGTPCGDP